MDGRHWRWMAGAFLLAALAACGGGGGDSGGGSAPPPLAPGEATVDAAGGTVGSAGGVTVIIPAGALEQPATIRIAKDSTDAPAVPAGLSIAGDVVAITPHGAAFNALVEVRLPVPPVALQPDQRLVIAKADPGGGWELLGDTEQRDGLLTARVAGFSYFAAFIVTYPQTLQAPVYDLATTLDCGPGGCVDRIGPVDWTLGWTPNQGLIPANCGAQPALTVSAREHGYASVPLPNQYPIRSAGSVSGTFQGTRSAAWLSVYLRCTSSDGGTAYTWSWIHPGGITWKIKDTYPSLLYVQSPAQLDVVPGTLASMRAVFSGGASVQTRSNAWVDRDIDRTVIEWERSYDQGRSWNVAGRSYENNADPRPFANVATDWIYWSVNFGFLAATEDQGGMLRPRGCYTPPQPGSTTRACATGTTTRINVLQGGAAPSFGTAPRSVLVRVGQTASFTAVAAGAPAPTLQWQSREANASGAWTDLSGASAGTYTTPVLALADNGREYRVVATNSLGSVTSAPVSVSVSAVDVAPTIGTQPSDLTVTAEQPAVFAVAARGTEALSYQWRVDGEPLTGENSPVLRLAGAMPGQSGMRFSVQISNAAGTVVSREATLTVVPAGTTPVATAPQIVTQPVDVRVGAGNTATFAVGVTGSAPLSYQWLRNGDAIAGATQAFYSLPAAQPADAGNYAVRVSHPTAGSVTSTAAVLTVEAPAASQPVVLTTQPAAQVQVPGGSVTFAVAATGTGPLSYQWLKDGQPVAGATTAVLTLGNISGSDAGQYAVTVGNTLGTVTSNAAALIVVGAPAITTQPASASVDEGATATFSVAAQGTGLRYQWLRNSVAIPGATTASHTTAPVTASDNGAVYAVVVYNAGGVVFSHAAVLTVAPAPAFPASAVALRANHADYGAELWLTDGTTNGSVLVKDIWPGAGNGQPRDFTRLGRHVYFVANDGSSGEEPWRSDGTEAGTVRVADIHPGPEGSFAWGLTACNGRLFFGANDGNAPGVYASDGTPAGTVRLASVILGTYAPVACMGDVVYFHGATAAQGGELWRSDGTVAGTSLVADIVPGSQGSNPEGFTVFKGQLYFQAANALWRTDGTTAGTMLVSADARPSNLSVVGELLFFNGTSGATGSEPWRSDGTAAGTLLLADLVPGSASSYPYAFTASNGVAFFAAQPGPSTPATLFRSDGTTAGTSSLASLRFVAAYGQSILDIDGTLYFSAAASGNDTELWKTDGTPAGTVLVTDLYPGSSASYPTGFFRLGNLLYFNGGSPDVGSELWRSDGSSAGTSLVRDFCAGCSGNPLPR